MNIIIQSLGFKSSEALENLIREKVSGIKCDQLIGANVVLYKGSSSNPGNDYCEIQLTMPGKNHFVKKHSEYFETAIRECVDILSQMIQKTKQKIQRTQLRFSNNFRADEFPDFVDVIN
ncbi:MAG: HPF/RaiA family ribosome-associated protein [Ferruginibacter sp.]